MEQKHKINASVVLYNTGVEDLQNLFSSFKNTSSINTLFVVDNSPTDKLYKIVISLTEHFNIHYIHLPENPGFGAGHNEAFKRSIEQKVDFHAVINPDVTFTDDVFSPIVDYIISNHEVGMIMPQILNEDGTRQNLPKLLPSPYSVLLRKLRRPRKVYEKFINTYELRFVGENITYQAPILSGCFTVFRISALQEVGLYDDRFFMYFEDWDMSRRMHKKFKTIYFPKISIIHGYESGANKNRKLFVIFVKSCIKYFNKWGWIIDKDRRKINRETLEQF